MYKWITDLLTQTDNYVEIPDLSGYQVHNKKKYFYKDMMQNLLGLKLIMIIIKKKLEYM